MVRDTRTVMCSNGGKPGTCKNPERTGHTGDLQVLSKWEEGVEETGLDRGRKAPLA